MGKVTFSSFCKAFTAHSERSMSHISRRLLKLITGCDEVKNKKGNRYSFKPKELLEFLNGESPIYENIAKAISNEVVRNHIRIDFEDACDELLDEDALDLVYEDLKRQVEGDESLSEDDKKRLLGGKGDLYSSGWRIFIKL